MIGSCNHFGGDRPIRAGQASPPGGTEGGKGRNMCAVAFSRKEGTFLSRVACSGGGARLVSRPAHFPEVPPLLVSIGPLAALPPGAVIGKVNSPPSCVHNAGYLATQLRMTITYPRRTYPPSFPMALSTGPEVWEDSCLTDHRCANHRFIRGVQHVSYHRARRRSGKYDIIEFRIEGGYDDF